MLALDLIHLETRVIASIIEARLEGVFGMDKGSIQLVAKISVRKDAKFWTSLSSQQPEQLPVPLTEFNHSVRLRYPPFANATQRRQCRRAFKRES